jgi:hypothetical protein
MWKLRLRGPKGIPAELEVASGADTTVGQLVELAGKATRVAAKRLVLRIGFPPKVLEGAEAEARARTIAEAGLRDRDVLVITRLAEPAPVSPSAVTAAPGGGSAKKSKAGKSKKRTGGWATGGAGVRLGQADEQPTAVVAEGDGTTAPSSPPAAAAAAGGPRSQQHAVDVYASAKKRRRVRMPGAGNRLGAPDDEAAAPDDAQPSSSSSATGPAAAVAQEAPAEPASVDEILRQHGFGRIKRSASALAAADATTLGSVGTRTEAARAAASAVSGGDLPSTHRALEF